MLLMIFIFYLFILFMKRYFFTYLVLFYQFFYNLTQCYNNNQNQIL
jgi:hypothetical protein